MSRYEDLAAKAGAWSKRYYDHLGECRHFAQLIAIRYLEYLAAPLDSMQFIGLTSTLGFDSGATRRLTELPDMVRGRRGEQYFGIVIALESSRSHGALDRALIGLRKGLLAWEVTWHGKKFRVPFDALENVDGMFEDVYTESLKGFGSEDIDEAHHFGFVPLETKPS